MKISWDLMTGWCAPMTFAEYFAEHPSSAPMGNSLKLNHRRIADTVTDTIAGMCHVKKYHQWVEVVWCSSAHLGFGEDEEFGGL